jgi:hypothetical protein
MSAGLYACRITYIVRSKPLQMKDNLSILSQSGDFFKVQPENLCLK